MLKVIITSAVLFVSTTSIAAPVINKFLGTYQLIDQKVDGNTFCFPQITLRQEDDGTIGLYGEDTSYGPLINAELNGEPRMNSASHGEALSSRKGKDTVTLDSGLLTFEYKGINSMLGLPVSRESDTVAIAFAKDGKTLAVTRTTFEGPVAGLGKRAKALCAYR